MVKAENGTAIISGNKGICAVEIASILGSFKHNLRVSYDKKDADEKYKKILTLADATCDELMKKDKREMESDKKGGFEQILDQLAETLSDIVVDAIVKKGDK